MRYSIPEFQLLVGHVIKMKPRLPKFKVHFKGISKAMDACSDFKIWAQFLRNSVYFRACNREEVGEGRGYCSFYLENFERQNV